MHRRSKAKLQQAGGDRRPEELADAAPAAAAPTTGARRRQQQQQQQQQHDSDPLPLPTHHRAAAAALAALLLLLACQRVAERVLAPQTGSWLAGSFCSLTLWALAAVGAVSGHAAEEGSPALAAARGGAAAPGLRVAAQAWAAAAASAAALTVPLGGPPGALAGRLLLAPSLDEGGGRRISDAELTLRAMALAAATAGPLFLAAGAAAGAAGGAALQSVLGPGARPQLLLLPLLAGVAAVGMSVGLPAALTPPHPAASLPPLVAAAALAMAAVLLPPAAAAAPPRHPGRAKKAARHAPGRGSWPRALAALAAAVFAALAAQRALTPCDMSAGGGAALAGGQFGVMWQCEAAGGGRLGVVEGTYDGQYRYHLLRWDHSVLGGEYVAPPDVARQPIYTAFYLQQAAVALRPGGSRSLHVGLGVGTAVKAMQRAGIAADSIELVPEVLAAAQHSFGLRPELHGGRALVGDARVHVPALAAEGRRYDYVLHDVFSGGGAPDALMSSDFYRGLARLLAPGGVLAVNYYGGKGPGLKEAWCRLRMVFDSVRAFSDVEKTRVRNHVLFASSGTDLRAANLTAAYAAAAAAQAEAEEAGRAEVYDPLQLRLWRSLPRQEVQLTYDRQRCSALLRRHGAPGGRPGRDAAAAGDEEEPGEESVGLPPGSAAQQRLRQRQRELGVQPAAARQAPPPWAWRALRALRQRHALATAHWVAMRTQFGDAVWLS